MKKQSQTLSYSLMTANGRQLLDEDLISDDFLCINRHPCMHRVSFRDRKLSEKLLTNAVKLKDGNFSRFFIARDLTYMQRGEFGAKCVILWEGRTETSHSAPPLALVAYMPRKEHRQ